MKSFFNEGDEQKLLGLPVGMLNDRDKVSMPGSQHGFINFLVAPLVLGSVQVFPPLQEFLEQLTANLGAWRDIWVEESEKPSSEKSRIELAKKDEDVKKLQGECEKVGQRAMFKTRGSADTIPCFPDSEGQAKPRQMSPIEPRIPDSSSSQKFVKILKKKASSAREARE